MALKNDDAAALARPPLSNVQPFPATQPIPSHGFSGRPIDGSEASLETSTENQPVRRGAVAGFVKVCERWQIGKARQIALLGYAENEFIGAQILAGRASGGQDVKDRVGLLIAIAVGLRALFKNNVASELRWLQTPRVELEGKSPINYMLEGRMVAILQVREIVDRERAL